MRRIRHFRFIETKARVDILNKLNGEPVFGITWLADRYDEEKYQRSRSAKPVVVAYPALANVEKTVKQTLLFIFTVITAPVVGERGQTNRPLFDFYRFRRTLGTAIWPPNRLIHFINLFL